MFTGDLGTRKVNLGGSNTKWAPSDRASFLEMQRRERQRKDLERKRQECALFVQRVWRGCRLRRILCQSVGRELAGMASLDWNPSEYPLRVRRILTLVWYFERMPYPWIEPVDLSNVGILAFALVDYFPDRIALPSTGTRVAVLGALFRLTVRKGDAVLVTRIFNRFLNGEDVGLIPHILRRLVRPLSLVELLDGAAQQQLLQSLQNEKALLFKFALSVVSVGGRLKESLRLPPWDESLVSPGLDMLQVVLGACLHVVEVVRGDIRAREEFVSDLLGWAEKVFARLDERERSIVQQCLVNRYYMGNMDCSLVFVGRFLDFSSLPQETLFQLATGTNLCRLLAAEIEVSMTWDPSIIIPWCSLMGSVVSGVVRFGEEIMGWLEFAKIVLWLNRCVFFRIVRSRTAESSSITVLDTLVSRFVRHVHSRKGLFPELAEESRWTVDESGDYLPSSVEGFSFEEAAADSTGERSVSVGGAFTNLLTTLSHAISFQNRLRFFSAILAQDQRLIAESQGRQRGGIRLKRVRRDRLLQDGLDLVFGDSAAQNTLKEIVQIEFVDRNGHLEAGIDGGGLFKEFLHAWILDAVEVCFEPLPGTGQLSPSIGSSNSGELYRSTGRAVGKAIYEMVLLEHHFGDAFLDRALGNPYHEDHLRSIDESLWRSLNFVKLADEKTLENLNIYFSLQDTELVPGGAQVPVTFSNKQRYVLLASWYYLYRQLERPSVEFAAGLSEVVPLKWLRIFSPKEINLIISGSPHKGFDPTDLRAHTVYGGGYADRGNYSVEIFWEILAEFSPSDQSAFLTFVTSCPRAPLLGFRVLHPKFGLHRVEDTSRLPTASTCHNLFKLPDYGNKRVMREKILLAIHSHSGFDLS